MEEVRLEDDKNPYTAKTRPPSGIAGFFVGIGLARTGKEADAIMLILALVAFGATAYLWWVGAPQRALHETTPIERARLEASTPSIHSQP